MITDNLLTNRSFSWVDVHEPRTEDFDRLNSEFNLPYLLVQDCLRPEHLPKYEQTDEGHFLMMRNFDLESGSNATTMQELIRKIALYSFRDFWSKHRSMLQDLRENIDHLFELHIALNDQRANEVMKVLTVFSTILLPLNFIASFYGMNFSFLPGLNSTSSIYILLLVMITMSVSAIWYFKRKGWFKTPQE